jgi:MerR family transcriptional regulator, light-induced transcriptional regulator
MRDPLAAVGRRLDGRRRMLSAQAAAAVLGTSPGTLSLWEERFGYPVPAGWVGGQPLYPEEAVIALREALNEELSIASAIEEARRRL